MLLCCGAGTLNSLFRFAEWRGQPADGAVWTCTNATDGSGTWSNVIYGTTITADTFNMTATDSSWSIMEGNGDSMNFSNSSSGLWLELAGGLSGGRMPHGFETKSNVYATLMFATNCLQINGNATAPNDLGVKGAEVWSDGTNLIVCLRNGAGTVTTNKLTMSAWP